MTTPLDPLVSARHDAASYNAAAEAPPEAVVWCDVNREFEPLLPAQRERLAARGRLSRRSWSDQG